MTKAKKIISIIVCLLALTVMVPIMIEYHNVSGLDPQFLDLQLFDWKQFSFLEFYLSRYIFWGALVLSTLIILSILVIAFYPKQHLEVKLSDKGGKLSLTNSAIEGFVKNLVIEQGLINNPSVKINRRRNKCLINVKGESASRMKCMHMIMCFFFQAEDGIRDGIKDGLVEFFGIDKAVKLKISVSDIQKKVTKKSTSRVK